MVVLAMDDNNQQNDIAASNGLMTFIDSVEAQRGKQLPETDADVLIAAAQAVISSIQN